MNNKGNTTSVLIEHKDNVLLLWLSFIKNGKSSLNVCVPCMPTNRECRINKNFKKKSLDTPLNAC